MNASILSWDSSSGTLRIASNVSNDFLSSSFPSYSYSGFHLNFLAGHYWHYRNMDLINGCLRSLVLVLNWRFNGAWSEKVVKLEIINFSIRWETFGVDIDNHACLVFISFQFFYPSKWKIEDIKFKQYAQKRAHKIYSFLHGWIFSSPVPFQLFSYD